MSEQDPQQVGGPQGDAEPIVQPIAAPPGAVPAEPAGNQPAVVEQRGTGTGSTEPVGVAPEPGPAEPVAVPVGAAPMAADPDAVPGPYAVPGAYGYPMAAALPDEHLAVDPRRRIRRRRAIVGSSAAAVIAAALLIGAATRPTATQSSTATTATDDRAPWSWAQDGYGYRDRGGLVPGGSAGSAGSAGSSGSSGSSSTGTGTSAATTATAAQQVGVVTVTSTLGYENATSAGTGMILSADGLVLTNNHVVENATAIQVTVQSTGKTYTATVLGTDKTADVALIKLQGASGLTPVTLDTNGVTNGEAITAIGNAEGTGTLVAAAGSVTATDQTMTASTDAASAETLSGLIEFSASVVSGDSGGPVLDSAGQVVGITTAASSGTGSTVAYAIDIQNAMTIVKQIESGQASSDVVIGYPAFLGVSIASSSQIASGYGNAGGSTSTTSGATIAGVIASTPAANAGLAAGDTITKVNSSTVSSADQLSTLLAGYKPGDKVSITWTAASTGTSHTATVTLVQGPVA